MANTIKLTLIKSTIGCKKNQIDCVRGLGLKKINSTSQLELTPQVRGMINKVSFLLKVEEV